MNAFGINPAAGGAFSAGYMQGLMMSNLAAARLNPGMNPAAQLGQMPGLGGQDATQTTLLALAAILMQLLQNQQNGGGAANALNGGSSSGGTSPSGDLSTPNADPSKQIPSAGPNASKGQIEGILDAAAQKYGIPPDILKAIAWKESRWNPGARGDGGKSYGMMQIYTSAHPNYDAAKGQNDIAYNVDYGAKLLRSLYDKHKDWKTAVMRYNGSGPMAQRYADDVMGNIVGSKPWAR